MIIYCSIFVCIKQLEGIFNFLLLFFSQFSSFLLFSFVYWKFIPMQEKNKLIVIHVYQEDTTADNIFHPEETHHNCIDHHLLYSVFSQFDLPI